MVIFNSCLFLASLFNERFADCKPLGISTDGNCSEVCYMDCPVGIMALAVYKLDLWFIWAVPGACVILVLRLLTPLVCMMWVIFSKRILFSLSISVYLSIRKVFVKFLITPYPQAFGSSLASS